MANLLLVSGSFALTENLIPTINRSVTNLAVVVTGNGGVLNPALATSVSAAALNLGGLSGALGWYFFINLDATNTISIMTSASGVNVLTLQPGEFAMGRFPSNITAPAAIAGAGTPLLEYAILPA